MDILKQYIIALSITSVTVSMLAAFVYFKGRRKTTYWTFALYCLSIALWSGCEAYSISTTSKDAALFWWRINHIGVIFIPAFFIHFVYSLLDITSWKRKLIPLAYIVAFIFTIVNCTRLLILEVVPKFSFRYFINPGLSYYIFFTIWVSWTIYGLFELFKAYFKSTGMRQNQLKYLCFSLLIGYVGGAPNFLPTFNIQIPILMPFGTYGIPICISMITYAILRYRLMDINIVLTRAGIFTVVYLIVLGIPFGIGFKLLGKGSWIAPASVMAVFATFGPFAYNYFRHRAETRLLAKKRLRHQKLREFSTYMMRFNKLNTLASLIVHHALKILEIKHAALYLLETDRTKIQRYNLIASYGIPHKENLPLAIPSDSSLVKELSKGLAVDKEHIKQKIAQNTNHNNLTNIQQELSTLKANIVIPAFLRFKPLGFIILGESRVGETFDQEDINVLQLLSNQAALAIENALFWQREEEKIIETQKEQIASDITVGAGHQFNNRLNAIGMAADTILLELLDRDVNQLSFEELKEILQKILDRLKKVSEECQFGGQITAGIMSLAGSAPENFTDFNLSPIIVSSIELVQMKHSHDKAGEDRPTVTINKTIPETLPLIFGSDSQIRDCLFNVIDNAYDTAYIKEEKITKKDRFFEWPKNQPYTPTIDINAFVKDSHLIITIADNGLGIKDTDKRKIFAGYFTTKATGIKGRGPGGHGIGLYTVKRLIQAHKGKIHFTSEYGKGTTFTIELPISKRNNISQHA